MVRPRRCRWVRDEPAFALFKPAGIPARSLDYVILTVGEYEAIRLKDLEGIEQKEAANKMDLSQPTFQRLVSSARKKIAEAIVRGKAIKIEGGEYRMVKGRGRMGGKAAGPTGNCICPKCGTKAKHQVGVPCYQVACPKCGQKMVRE